MAQGLRLLPFLLAFFVISQEAQAQKLFNNNYSGVGFLVPSFREAVGTADDFTFWDVFEPDPTLVQNWAYNHAFTGDQVPGASNATLTQTGTSSAFFTSGFNIYSFSEATAFRVDNTLTAHPQNVVFQFETLGTFIDYDSIQLNYTVGGNTYSIAPTNIISESRVITGGFGGFTNRVSVQWDLSNPALTFLSYNITFSALGSSNSFNMALLETSTGPYTEIVPSARTWDGGGGNANWSNAANWSTDTIHAAGANVTIGSGAPASITLDGSREVGQLDIARTGSFAIVPGASTTLTINTGIDVQNTGAAVQISSNIYLGGHNFINVESGSTLLISSVISGAPSISYYPAAGIYKTGEGELALTNNNTFLGGVILDGGVLRISGNNSYNGSTAVYTGRLLLQSDTLNSASISSALGRATDTVLFGTGGNTATTAEIILDGSGRSFARSLTVQNGNDTKRLGAINSGTGATFSGAVNFQSSTTGVRFTATAATDKVTFTGTISGGAVTGTVTIDGAGEVIYSGVNKSYGLSTIVDSGILRIATGITSNGIGNYTVNSGGQLMVDGTLAGSGTLTMNGGTLGGTGTVSKAATFQNGSRVSAGNSTGTLTFSSGLTFGGAGRMKWEVSNATGTAGTGWDFISVSGALNITANSGSKFVVELNSLTASQTPGLAENFNPLGTYDWLILTATSINGFTADAFAFELPAFTGNSGTFSMVQTGNSLYIRYVGMVPEPSRAMLLLSGMAFLVMRRRRRNANHFSNQMT